MGTIDVNCAWAALEATDLYSRIIFNRTTKPVISLTLEQIEEAGNECSGYCVACGYNQSGVEPDAEKYMCEQCGKRAVMGSIALIMHPRVNLVENEYED